VRSTGSVASMDVTADRYKMSQGLALGLVMNDVWALPGGSTSSIELAFKHAWQAWPHHEKFPTIQLGVRSRVGTMRQMVAASKLKHVPYLYWDRDEFEDVIRTRESVNLDPLVLENLAQSIDESVPAEAWRDLAAVFLAELED